MQPQLAGKVLCGTCGWSDYNLGQGAKGSAEQRLVIHARHFPCVEVDTSSYAIPKPDSTAKWAKAALSVYPGFKFHFKAFGLFCHQSAPINTLPWQARQLLQEAGLMPPAPPSGPSAPKTTVSLSEMPPGCEQACWDAYHAALEPVVRAGAMGCCVFQFQLSFLPGASSREYVLRCRRRLREDVPMAVEFRNRAWFQDPAAMADLVSWCKTHGLILIAADELRHETFQKDRAQQGLPAGQVREVMAMSLAVTRPDMLVVRLHRRHGTTDRLLAQEEHQAWAQRLASVSPALTGPIYYLWGTDWEDAPLVNARALMRALPPELRYDHEAEVARLTASRPGTITAMFSKAARPVKAEGTATQTTPDQPSQVNRGKQRPLELEAGQCESLSLGQGRANVAVPVEAAGGPVHPLQPNLVRPLESNVLEPPMHSLQDGHGLMEEPLHGRQGLQLGTASLATGGQGGAETEHRQGNESAGAACDGSAGAEVESGQGAAFQFAHSGHKRQGSGSLDRLSEGAGKRHAGAPYDVAVGSIREEGVQQQQQVWESVADTAGLEQQDQQHQQLHQHQQLQQQLQSADGAAPSVLQQTGPAPGPGLAQGHNRPGHNAPVQVTRQTGTKASGTGKAVHGPATKDIRTFFTAQVRQAPR